jgi:hypothetical protein
MGIEVDPSEKYPQGVMWANAKILKKALKRKMKKT